MAKRELTDLLLRKGDMQLSKRHEIWDAVERGLYVRFYPSRVIGGELKPARRVWGVRYRSEGRQSDLS